MAGTPVSKGKRPLRALSASDKIEAIQRVNDGESKASVARQIGVPESTLRGWCKNEDKLRYMSSRHSTPDTDKSSDGMMDNGIPEKRAKYDLSSVPVNYSHTNGSYSNGVDVTDGQVIEHAGLDLSRLKEPESLNLKSVDALGSDYSQYAKSSMDLGKNISDLNKANNDLANILSKENKLKIDPGAKISMSAISPLSTLNHLSGMSGLSQNHLGMSFNEIATNLSLIAQLNPSLNTLANSINSSAKMLRSIRSPKPGHISSGSALNLTDKHKSDRKSHSHSDTYTEKSSRTRSNHNAYKDHTVDDAVWYWFKKQQAMLNLTNSTASQIPMSLSHSTTSNRSGKDSSHSRSSAASMAAIPPVIPPLDKNSWFWQYYKQFTSNLGLQDDKTRSTLKPENYDILYSRLTKENQEFPLEKTREPSPSKIQDGAYEKIDENSLEKITSYDRLESEIKHEDKADDVNRKECISPNGTDKADKDSKNQVKVRAVLDNLLLLNNNNVPLKEKEEPVIEDAEKDSNAENEFSCEVSEALEHGEKFLKWLEACQEPSVTRMQVHQLKGLLNNIKANAMRRSHDGNGKDRISRRK